MYLLGYDIGSSSVKAALVEISSGKTIASVQSPDLEMGMLAVEAGWAEQDPEMWWEHICKATHKLLNSSHIKASEIKSIGIAYQMHGLVVVDKHQQVLRQAIIWCDSRAVSIGNQAFDDIGHEKCLSHLLNSPGNFTASKLKWIKDNEPDIYSRIHKIMLPGDYIAMRLTGEIVTTASGLSEGMLWDFKKDGIADLVLDYYGMDKKLIPEVVPTFSVQGKLTQKAAEQTGLNAGIAIGYRAGDQPNNAMSLAVYKPGEVAATGGTSGVVYGVMDKVVYDPQSRVNGFAHVNHTKEDPRIGILLCLNGAGIQYNWVRKNMTLDGLSYKEMDALADEINVGSDGLCVYPFGNGAERMFVNNDIGSHIANLQFNRHTNAHLYRASLEGISFSFVYGMKILQEMGVDISVIRVGNDNLFRSSVFSQTIANTLDCSINMVETNGAIGAAKASGIAIGIYDSLSEAIQHKETLMTYEPKTSDEYLNAYANWENHLNKLL